MVPRLAELYNLNQMKKLTLSTLLFLTYLSFISAQVSDPNFTPFAWGGSVGGFICTAKPNQTGLDQVNRAPVAGFSFGGAASFRQRKLYFETGLYYNSEGYAFSASVTENRVIRKQDNEYKFYSVMVPLKFVIPVHATYSKHLPSLALNLSYATKQTLLQTTEYENAPLTKNVYDVSANYGKLSAAITIAYGVEFDLDLNNAMRFEPNFQFTMVNANFKDYKTVINNIGIRTYYLFLR